MITIDAITQEFDDSLLWVDLVKNWMLKKNKLVLLYNQIITLSLDKKETENKTN